ncbi:MAG: hypothetical protein ACYTKD_22265 [Planctomycetota bacterium]|jgi:hypothetical protein
MDEGAASVDVQAIGDSVRTSFRRTLKYACLCAVTVGLLALLFQLLLFGMSMERKGRYVQVAQEWRERWDTFEGAETGVAALMLATLAAGYLGLMCLFLGKWRQGAVLAGALLGIVVFGLLVPSLWPYTAMAAVLTTYFGQVAAAMIPLLRVEKGDVYRRAFWRHFRLRNLVWPCISMGFVAYYLLIMAYSVSLDALLHLVFHAAGAARFLRILPDPLFPAEAPLDDLLHTTFLATGMGFYHFMCSAWGVMQLDYIVDAGMRPIRHREFWWPFRQDGAAPPTPSSPLASRPG